jgi:hypothetical protein
MRSNMMNVSEREIEDALCVAPPWRLYSALVIDPNRGIQRANLFNYSGGMSLPEAPVGHAATAAHTNVPRSGEAGLPIDWYMRVRSVRFRSALMPTEALLEFLRTTEAYFTFNSKVRAEGSLYQMLEAVPCDVIMRPCLTYNAIISPTKPEALCKELLKHPDTAQIALLGWLELDGPLYRELDGPLYRPIV